ncbi:hypothetical protein TH1_10965 [Thalassospira lucentensis MCCC 1A00383 = DSM 14000]|nr:hypothetical protein TH1_10965 [Thalassospira lucentensis MCCC 1A00383 = DSM 14000]
MVTAAETQLGGRKDAIDDQDVAIDAAVDDLGLAVRVEHKERRHLTLHDPGREHDVNAPPLADQKEESMNKVSQNRIIGIDVSRDWLDIDCLPDGEKLRLPNSDQGHARIVDLAQSISALVCFEATGGQEWRLWSALDAAGIATR